MLFLEQESYKYSKQMLKISKVATRFQDVILLLDLSQSLGVCLYMSRVAWPAPNYRLQADG